MENELTHPVLPLTIADEKILSPDGIVGYLDYGEQYVYVCFYRNKLVVAEHNTFDSIATRFVERVIKEKYYYAFKILCAGKMTAVVRCVPPEIILVGVIEGYLIDGTRIWCDSNNIKTWPGLKE